MADNGADAGNPRAKVPAVMISACSSGCGKTTVTMGIIGALKRRGQSVQPYKVGPDYIDPAFHSRAAGRPCRNLDSWMTGSRGVQESYARGLHGADVAVIEGVMGLFDGRGGAVMDGSSAEVSALLDVPVILILNAAGMSGSAAAMAAGFARLRPEVNVAGVILNGIGSNRHRDFVTRAVEDEAGLPVAGSIPRLAGLEMPHRHLGLVPAGELSSVAGIIEAAADAIEEHIDIDMLIGLARKAGPQAACQRPAPSTTKAKIAVARDDAFNFYYYENLERLEEAGAELAYFSPLTDSELPAGARGLILGGGFPEMFAEKLAFNFDMIESVSRAVEAGMPTLAECGGLIYLCRSLTDQAGDIYRLAGTIPCDAAMGSGGRKLGYRELEAATGTHLFVKGARLRAHEFHWSNLEPRGCSHYDAAFQVMGGEGTSEGFAGPSLLASYMHLHFGAHPEMASRFVGACREWNPAAAGVHA